MISAAYILAGSFAPMLRDLSKVLEKGAEHAAAKKFDVAVLVDARLAPDMYTLRQQVQLACHHATEAIARLTGRAASPPETPTETFDALKTRLDTTIQALDKAEPSAFEDADERVIVMPIPGGAMAFEMKAAEFVRDWALPHFYFHVVTAYDVLRHNGVDIGKRDYLASVGKYLRRAVQGRSMVQEQ